MYIDHDTRKIAAAQYYSSLGFTLFPCHSTYTCNAEQIPLCSCGNESCPSPAKHPLTQRGVHDATNDPDTLKRYFTGINYLANVAIATGEPSGIFVLDVDDIDTLERLESDFYPLPKTPTVQTPRKGCHYYFRYDSQRHATLKNSVKFYGALDVRTTGGYVLLPPSRGIDGYGVCVYTWLVPPHVNEIANAPDWLVALMPKHNDNALTIAPTPTQTERIVNYLANVPPAISGQRGHDHTFGVVCRLVEEFGLQTTDDELLNALATWNATCTPPWMPTELRHKITDARTKHATKAIHAASPLTFASRLDSVIESLIALRDNVTQMPTPTETTNETPNETTNETTNVTPTPTEPATLTELLDWRNAHAVRFARDADGTIRPADEYASLVTPSIALAIDAHRETLMPLANAGDYAMSSEEFFVALSEALNPSTLTESKTERDDELDDELDEMFAALDAKLKSGGTIANKPRERIAGGKRT